MPIHVNIEDLLSARTVETDRIEFKQGWNPDAIYRSICAFANDFDNIGGGYILLGVKENKLTRTAQRPVNGLTTTEIADIQQKMIGFNNLLKPVYHPHFFIESVDEKQIVILWVPGGSNRPYLVPEMITAKGKRYFHYIRKYANSVKANLEEQQELISLANQVPFDDRANTKAQIEDISMLLVKNYLLKIKSRLADQVSKTPNLELLGQMELISGPNEHVFPRNVGLMLFSENPENFFPYTQVEIVEFPDGDAGSHYEQDPFTGPVPEQISRTLNYLKDKLIKEKVIKPADKAESIRISSYPYQAIEETLVNAFYHRDYQQREPIEIRIYPNSIIIINHGGPDKSIRLEAFNQGQVRSRRYRNRRLGEFLKELGLTEGRATGIPTILKALQDNGSSAPRFTSDDDRTFFEVELFKHPAFKEKAPFTLDTTQLKPTLDSIDAILNKLMEHCLLDHNDVMGSAIAGIQAGTIAEDINTIDNQADEVVGTISSTIAGTIAGAIAGAIAESEQKILDMANQPKDRETLLNRIGVTNQRKNYDNYMLPLVNKGWLTMTIPDKPTSPNQKYLTTLKGRLVLKFLKLT
ncbi:MAG: transcriptional regulator [Chitinophagaceae bacterium]|nr:MAG: transcriptional regulator [Chitinophagaceae bacterium]